MVENSDSTKLCTCGTRKHFGSSMDHKDGANGKITLQTFNQGRNDWKDISNEKSEFVGISLAKIPYTNPFRKYSPFFRKNR